MKKVTLPNTFLCGAQKGGTTWLHEMLASHPDVFFPARPQELHFFDRDRNYAKGIQWYARHFRACRGQSVVAQTAPNYMYEPAVPPRILAVCPDPRFLFLLRNPVDRAYSHYWHAVRKGYETLPFEEALQMENTRIQQSPHARRRFSYVARGRYVLQLKRFEGAFGKDRMLLLLSSDMKANAGQIRRDCSTFLAIDEKKFPAGAHDLPARNVARSSRRNALRIARRYLCRGGRLPLLRRWLDRVNLRPAKYPEMSSDTRQRLLSLFEDDIVALEELSGFDLSGWRL